MRLNILTTEDRTLKMRKTFKYCVDFDFGLRLPYRTFLFARTVIMYNYITLWMLECLWKSRSTFKGQKISAYKNTCNLPCTNLVHKQHSNKIVSAKYFAKICSAYADHQKVQNTGRRIWKCVTYHLQFNILDQNQITGAVITSTFGMFEKQVRTGMQNCMATVASIA